MAWRRLPCYLPGMPDLPKSATLPGLDWPRLPASRPLVMGIVNVTADSFSGDGLAGKPDAAIAQARAMVAAGADMLDLGAESTRPGAEPVDSATEQARLLHVLQGLHDIGVPISVDTRYAATMRAVLAAGAHIINDISALEDDPDSLAAVAEAGCPVVLMHKQGQPATMQQDPRYGDVVAEVLGYLLRRVDICVAAGIRRDNIILDPGIGFGKTVAHNVALLRAIPRFTALGLPLLIGLSRKSLLGALADAPDPAHRLGASLAGALFAASRGAQILRVHDVADTVQALKVWRALDFQAPGDMA